MNIGDFVFLEIENFILSRHATTIVQLPHPTHTRVYSQSRTCAKSRGKWPPTELFFIFSIPPPSTLQKKLPHLRKLRLRTCANKSSSPYKTEKTSASLTYGIKIQQMFIKNSKVSASLTLYRNTCQK